MSDITLPLTGPQMVARLAALSREDAQAVLLAALAQNRAPGLAVLAATTLGQVQAAVGMRRPINPFAY